MGKEDLYASCDNAISVPNAVIRLSKADIVFNSKQANVEDILSVYLELESYLKNLPNVFL